MQTGFLKALLGETLDQAEAIDHLTMLFNGRLKGHAEQPESWMRPATTLIPKIGRPELAKHFRPIR